MARVISLSAASCTSTLQPVEYSSSPMAARSSGSASATRSARQAEPARERVDEIVLAEMPLFDERAHQRTALPLRVAFGGMQRGLIDQPFFEKQLADSLRRGHFRDAAMNLS